MSTEGPDLDAMLQALGREIRAERVRRGWSRAELGTRADVSEKQVGKIERGERGQLVEAWRISQALGVDFGAMVSRVENAS